MITRRGAVLGGVAALAGCERPREVAGGFVGSDPARGHLLRAARAWPDAAVSRRTQVVIAGAGIAGLAAARALRARRLEDFAVLDVEDAAGGNSRGSEIGGMACPLGARALPLPGDAAREVQDLLEELGVRRRVAGRWQYDARSLSPAPQERLYTQGAWQPGLLPLQGVGAATLAQYRRFAGEIEALRRRNVFRIPLRAPAQLAAWDHETFAAWLDARGFTDAQLRWYLDHCCRDDYGVGLGTVSAAAGLQYFAGRHGFRPPDAGESPGHDEVLTWPQGNAFLARALAAPLEDRLRTGRLVVRIAEHAHGVDVDAWDFRNQRVERWQAARCIVALPVSVAARVIESPPQPVLERARGLRQAPWVVANLHLDQPPPAQAGAPLAWNNVVQGADGLGYVVARPQRVAAAPGPTVLTWYAAPGEAARGDVLQQPWTYWRDRIVQELSVPHPDLPRQLARLDVARYGHGTAIPAPGVLSRLPAAPATARLRFAHGDWAGYSNFEEAFTLGHTAGSR